LERKNGRFLGAFIMTQLILPYGFELITCFSWDDLPAALRGASRAVAKQPASSAYAHLLPPARTADCVAPEEDAERWDGLS
jgi:hypothetical protein